MRLVAALAGPALLLALLPPTGVRGQVLHTLFTRGGPEDATPFGTVVSLEVHPADRRIRVVDDSARVHVFDGDGRRLGGPGAVVGWPTPGSEEEEVASDDPETGARDVRVRLGPSALLRVPPDSAAVRLVRTAGDSVTDDRTFGLPRLDGEEGPPDFTVEGALPDGDGRAWLRLCASDGCGEPERWVVLEPGPASAPGEPPSLSGIVLPSAFRLVAVRGTRLYGVQGRPGRQELHVMEMREEARRR